MNDLLLSYPNTRSSRSVVKKFELKIQDEATPLLVKFTTWQNFLFIVDSLEDNLFENETDEAKKLYRAFLGTAIALGQWLILDPGIEEVLTTLHCTKADLEAKLNVLRDAESLWHNPSDPEKNEARLNQIFCGHA